MQTKQFNEFGYQYQAKLLGQLMTDKVFASTIYDALSEDYFGSESLQFIAKVILEYFQEYHSMPSAEVFKVMLAKLDNANLKIEINEDLRKIIQSSDTDDAEFIQKTAIEFCKNQELKFAILDSVELLNDGNMDAIRSRIDDAYRKGQEKEIGLDYVNQIEDRYSEEARTTVSTGFTVLDDLIAGGLGVGEVGCIVGNSGAGKSWMLCKIAVAAMLSGLKVLYITLELNASYVGIRMDGLLTKIPIRDLPNNKEFIKKLIESNVRGNCRVVSYPTQFLSIVKLRALLDRLNLMGESPDLLVIDYADLMHMPDDGTRYDQQLKKLYEQLRGVSAEYKCPVWTVSQANRSSHDEELEYIGADKISDSLGKHMTSDVMLSIKRTAKDKQNNKAILHVVKNRLGEDGISLPMQMDTHNCIINVFEPKSKNQDKQDIEEATTYKLTSVKQLTTIDGHFQNFANEQQYKNITNDDQDDSS